jgi:hypothetical protein
MGGSLRLLITEEDADDEDEGDEDGGEIPVGGDRQMYAETPR